MEKERDCGTCEYLMIKKLNLKLIKELLYDYEHTGYPMNTKGYIDISVLLFSLNQHVTLLTRDCYEVNIEATLESIRSSFMRR